ncbi:unnamed protein product [Parascedosporium putredinis]|uniref:Uncharacterized protein n=1 Tax=Parascedosporium putredinis TaxID=1442378 RepID=A0A9P1H497_9PEZI|nr:unnamed protein product [Parascedosporium putredinis]CAI7996433.1 unnamed protein product [Parascedosporium putredinis]
MAERRPGDLHAAPTGIVTDEGIMPFIVDTTTLWADVRRVVTSTISRMTSRSSGMARTARQASFLPTSRSAIGTSCIADTAMSRLAKVMREATLRTHSQNPVF